MNLDLRTLAPLVCLLVDLGAFISLSDSDEAAAAAAAAAASAAAAAAAAKAACFDNSENNAIFKKLYRKHRNNKKSVKTRNVTIRFTRFHRIFYSSHFPFPVTGENLQTVI